MSSNVLLISDDLERSEPAVKKLGKWLHVKSVALSDYSENSAQGALFLVIDIDLSDPGIIEQFKQKFQTAPAAKGKIFLTRNKRPTEIYQANALGAVSTLPSEFEKMDVVKLMARYAANPNIKHKWQNVPETTRQAIETIRSLNDSFYLAVSSNGPLPKAEVISSCDQIAESLRENTIGSWLEVVRRHDSHTFRHSMTVSGIAVAFALHLGMRNADVQRIAEGALMHDIGKARISLSILDKPGKLSPEERTEINKHPEYGAEILRLDGQFDDEVVEIALHHHEMLDGTGYPFGLTGSEISDPVRIITIVDIHSALIDQRSYKDSMPADEAYQVLQDMDGKLDMDIVKAFETIAHAAGSQTRAAPAYQGAAAS